MYYNFLYYFILFIMYSFLGWIVDVTDVLINTKKLVNRGFLIGPICPIYGVGLLLITLLLNDYTDRPLVLFILTIFICMTLEYFTSYVMEKLFNARWWDYSDKKYNLNGRICLETTIPFGLGGLLVMYVINPLFTKVLSLFNHNILIIIGTSLLTIFVIDVIVSFKAIAKVKQYFLSKYHDDTEEVNRRVKDYLIKLSPLTKRLMESFPNVRVRISKLKHKIEKTVRRKKK